MDTRQSDSVEPTDPVVDRMESTIRGNPQAAVMIALGMGLVVGLILGSGFSEAVEPERGWLDRKRAEQFGRRMLASLGDQMSNRIR